MLEIILNVIIHQKDERCAFSVISDVPFTEYNLIVCYSNVCQELLSLEVQYIGTTHCSNGNVQNNRMIMKEGTQSGSSNIQTELR